MVKTKKSNILKYYVVLPTSRETRKDEVNFIKNTFLPYITHEDKINAFEEGLISGKTKD